MTTEQALTADLAQYAALLPALVAKVETLSQQYHQLSDRLTRRAVPANRLQNRLIGVIEGLLS